MGTSDLSAYTIVEVPTIQTPHPPAPFEGSELNPTVIEALERLLVGTGLCLSDVNRIKTCYMGRPKRVRDDPNQSLGRRC